jgi:hypothetical protein
VPNYDNLAYDIKRIFKIPDEHLIIESGTHGYPDLETDELCTYAPYFHADHIQVLCREYSTAPKKKPCVALAMHHNGGLADPTGHYGMPYNKFATADEYNQLIQRLTAMGYDVITMNQSGMVLEQKIYLLNELCDFVIGYEGGLGHLAHVLGIPYFCLPWRLNDMGHPGIHDPQQNGWYDPIPAVPNSGIFLNESTGSKIKNWQNYKSFYVDGASAIDATMKAMEIIVEAESQSSRQTLEHIFTEPSPWA